MDRNEENWKRDIDKVAREERCLVREGNQNDIHRRGCEDNVCKNGEGEYHYRYDIDDETASYDTEDLIDDANSDMRNFRSGGGLATGALRSNTRHVRNNLHNKLRRDIDRINDIQTDIF